MKRKLVIATLTATALIGTGTVSAVALADDGGQKSAQVTSTSTSTPGSDDDGGDDGREDRDDRDDRDDDRRNDDFAPAGLRISAADAAETGAAKGTVTSVDLDDDSGDLAWEVKAVDGNGTEHEFLVDADSGKLTQQPADHDRWDDRGGDDDRDDRDDD